MIDYPLAIIVNGNTLDTTAETDHFPQVRVNYGRGRVDEVLEAQEF